MPFLSEQERAEIAEAQKNDEMIKTRRAEILASIPQFRAGSSCRLCGMYINTPVNSEIDPYDAARDHEKSHPEYDEFFARGMSLEMAKRANHDHECVPGRCLCKCGCSVIFQCITGWNQTAKICSGCELNVSRDRDSDCGLQEEPKNEINI